MTEPMTLAEKCRLVAYYGDISEANRKRWARHKGTRLLTSLMSDADPDRERDILSAAVSD